MLCSEAGPWGKYGHLIVIILSSESQLRDTGVKQKIENIVILKKLLHNIV